MAAITFKGEELIAKKQAAKEVMEIDQIVLANIPGLDPTKPVDRNEQLPSADKISLQAPVSQSGYINPNLVVYSLMLTTGGKAFDFNWIGLYSSKSKVVIAISYLPVQTKSPQVAMTRNFMIEYSGAKETGDIKIDAKSWQVDFSARMNGIDERGRVLREDTFGRQLFYGDTCKVTKDSGGYYNVANGPAGIVAGIKFPFTGKKILIESFPNKVWLDISQQNNALSDVQPIIKVVVSNDVQKDYIDNNGVRHYLEKISDISHEKKTKDLRNTLNSINNAGYTHTDIMGAVNDENNRQYVRLAVNGAIYRRALNQKEYNKTPDSAKFTDKKNGLWVLHITDIINVRWFGALGNGVSDDTLAIQDSINYTGLVDNSDRRFIFIPKGTYRITKQLSIADTSHVTIKGDSGEGIGATTLQFIHPKDDSIKCVINSSIQNLSLLNMRIEQIADVPHDKLSPVVSVLCKRPRTATADVDTTIIGCSFKQFNTAIEHWGRGLTYINNSVVECGDGIQLEWPNIGDYIETPDIPISLDATGFRAFRIINNRFHSLSRVCVKNTGINARKIHSLQISEAMLDIGRRIFEGVLIDSSINDCQSIQTPIKVLVLNDGSKNYQVSDIVISGNSISKRIPDYSIEIKGEHSNANYSNIVIDLCKSDAIRLAGATLTNVDFSSITASNIQDKSKSVIGSENSTLTDVRVTGIGYSGSNIDYLIRTHGKTTGHFTVSSYSLGAAGRLCNSAHANTLYETVIDEKTKSLQTFKSSSGTFLGALSYKNAGTNGITIESIGSLNIDSKDSVRPYTDDAITLGAAPRRWEEIFAVNDTINTSDETEKLISEIPNNWLIAAWNIKQVRFKWLNQIKRNKLGKRQTARWHIGYSAQAVFKTLKESGIKNPWEIAFMCKDAILQDLEDGTVLPIINDKTGLPVERWGLRINELNTLKLAAIQRKLRDYKLNDGIK